MHRIDTPNAVSGMFSDGNPAAGVQGTILSDDWLNAVQEEVARVIEDEGIVLDKQTNTQLASALDARSKRLTGSRITFTAPSALNAGDVHVLGDLVGVIETTVAISQTATLLLGGEHTVPKSTSDDMSTVGARVWWDDGATESRAAAATGRRQFATVAQAAVMAATTVVVRLGAVPAAEA